MKGTNFIRETNSLIFMRTTNEHPSKKTQMTQSHNILLNEDNLRNMDEDFAFNTVGENLKRLFFRRESSKLFSDGSFHDICAVCDCSFKEKTYP